MIEITTPRLTIRDHISEDLSHWHRLFSDRQNMRFVEQLQCHTIEGSRARLQSAIDAIHAVPRVKYFFAMELMQTGEFIGAIGFMTEPIEDGLLGGIGWFLLPERQGQGYAAEAFAALIPRMFGGWGVTVIDAGCNAANPASERVMLKCGMKLVRKYDDRLQYQLTKKDWENS